MVMSRSQRGNDKHAEAWSSPLIDAMAWSKHQVFSTQRLHVWCRWPCIYNVCQDDWHDWWRFLQLWGRNICRCCFLTSSNRTLEHNHSCPTILRSSWRRNRWTCDAELFTEDCLEFCRKTLISSSHPYGSNRDDAVQRMANMGSDSTDSPHIHGLHPNLFLLDVDQRVLQRSKGSGIQGKAQTATEQRGLRMDGSEDSLW